MFLIVFELVAVVTVILSDAFKFCVNVKLFVRAVKLIIYNYLCLM